MHLPNIIKRNIEKHFDDRYDNFINIEKKDDEITVSTSVDKRKYKAMTGTIAAHIQNMIKGLEKKFRYKVRINYTHFPMTVEVKDGKIMIKNFLGSKGIRTSKIIGDVSIKVEKTDIFIEGNNKEDVSQTAANIEMSTRLPKKDRRVFGDGCFIESKGE